MHEWARSWRPFVTSLDARPSLIVRVVNRHVYLVNNMSTQALNDTSGCDVVRIAGKCDCSRNQTDERRKGKTRLPRVTVTPKTLRDLKPEMTGAGPNVLRIPDTKVDVPDIASVGSEDAELETGNESTRQIAGDNLGEAQRDLAKRQRFFRRVWKQVVCGRRDHGREPLGAAGWS
jgi:hypothetical protein